MKEEQNFEERPPLYETIGRFASDVNSLASIVKRACELFECKEGELIGRLREAKHAQDEVESLRRDQQLFWGEDLEKGKKTK